MLLTAEVLNFIILLFGWNFAKNVLKNLKKCLFYATLVTHKGKKDVWFIPATTWMVYNIKSKKKFAYSCWRFLGENAGKIEKSWKKSSFLPQKLVFDMKWLFYFVPASEGPLIRFGWLHEVAAANWISFWWDISKKTQNATFLPYLEFVRHCLPKHKVDNIFFPQ